MIGNSAVSLDRLARALLQRLTRTNINTSVIGTKILVTQTIARK